VPAAALAPASAAAPAPEAAPAPHGAFVLGKKLCVLDLPVNLSAHVVDPRDDLRARSLTQTAWKNQLAVLSDAQGRAGPALRAGVRRARVMELFESVTVLSPSATDRDTGARLLLSVVLAVSFSCLCLLRLWRRRRWLFVAVLCLLLCCTWFARAARWL
jgi:hypothetical protein